MHKKIKNKISKKILEKILKASDIFSKNILFNKNFCKKSFKKGALWMYDNFLVWKDPNKELPEKGKIVIIKTLNEKGYENTYIAHLDINNVFLTDTGFCIGLSFENNVFISKHIKVIGWKYIEN